MKNTETLGFRYLLDGFQLILKPGLKRYVIIPLLINIILFASLFYFAQHFFSDFITWVEHHLPHWLSWLGSILWVIFFIGYFLIMIYTFVTFANIVGAPFNSFLAEKVEHYLTGHTHNQSLTDTFKDIPRIIGRQLSILGYYLPRAGLMLLLFFVPILQILAPLLWFFFNAWFMTLQYIDYPTDNNHIPLKSVRDKLAQKKALSLSFGMGVLVFSMVPILNFFIIPAAVAGATKLWLEEFH